MTEEEKKYQEIIARLTSDPEKYANIRKILLDEIRDLQGLV